MKEKNILFVKRAEYNMIPGCTPNILVCKNIKFYSPYDKKMFVKMLERINCVEEIEEKGKGIHIQVWSYNIFDNNLRDLIAIFYRYKVDMSQLKRFLTPCNKKWFYGDDDSFWHKLVFGEATTIIEEVVFVCRPLKFYTGSDKEIMFEWIDKINNVKKIEELKGELHLFVQATDLPPSDLVNFIGLFNRYGFDLNQLKVFMNDENKQWFNSIEFKHGTK